MMDNSLYKSVATRRGIKYSYYFSPPTAGKPVLLLLHGFPCTSYDWRYQVSFFKAQGYGLIVPDMLGYGRTDKPTDPAQYVQRLISQDIIDILDAENVQKAIAIGHDWGCATASRLANCHSDRFIAFAFLAVGYVAPTGTKYEDLLAQSKQLSGSELFGYWSFFSEKDSHKTIEKNFDSFYSMLLADDAELWKAHVSPLGALKAWIEANKRTALVAYVPKEEVEIQKQHLLEGGLEAPLCWYKVNIVGLEPEDQKGIPQENHLVHQPVFFGATLRDYVCRPDFGKMLAAKCCVGPLTVRDYDTGHWVMWEEKDKLNQELLEWIQGL
ncbi:putative epoxide hydrolase [Lyophyllum shimeji]|uniref:Epoxide hydrolase n=1 Tax=Lyophyllum shimeji TaxID=47721 RepID=A0A9P3UTG3_LYOSH|nr:putative epoxide hydrolase [Lyophyllum shimeji]